MIDQQKMIVLKNTLLNDSKTSTIVGVIKVDGADVYDTVTFSNSDELITGTMTRDEVSKLVNGIAPEEIEAFIDLVNAHFPDSVFYVDLDINAESGDWVETPMEFALRLQTFEEGGVTFDSIVAVSLIINSDTIERPVMVYSTKGIGLVSEEAVQATRSVVHTDPSDVDAFMKTVMERFRGATIHTDLSFINGKWQTNVEFIKAHLTATGSYTPGAVDKIIADTDYIDELEGIADLESANNMFEDYYEASTLQEAVESCKEDTGFTEDDDEDKDAKTIRATEYFEKNYYYNYVDDTRIIYKNRYN